MKISAIPNSNINRADSFICNYSADAAISQKFLFQYNSYEIYLYD